MDDNDFIMRQLKAISEGFGMILGKGNSPKSEVVYQQQQNQKGKMYTDIDELLLHHKYDESIQYVYGRKFELDRNSYYQLGMWLVKKLKSIHGINVEMVQEFEGNMQKYK